MRLRAGPGLSILLCLAVILLWAAGQRGAISRSQAGEGAPSVTVIDGDTIELDGEVVQLYGIDAPELGQRCAHDGVWVRCGLTAAFELNKQLRLSRRDVRCYPADAGGAPGRICFAGDVDVAQSLLTTGSVTASPEANPDYRALEDKARAARLGLWHSEFVDPPEWRLGRRLPGEPAPGPEDCPIKAVTLDDGRGVFYVPTDEAYDALTLDPARGDRLYCSDETARKDGWRRPIQPPDP